MSRREIKAGQPLFKRFVATVKEVGDRTFEWVVSTASRDRENDTIAVEGWELEEFKQNPVILWAHNHREPPIGRATKIWTAGRALRAHIEFMPREISPFADMIYEQVRAGYLRATSVGFIPLEWSLRKDEEGLGVDFTRQSLLEISVVPVPALSEALIAAAKRHGVDTRRLKLDLIRPRRPLPDEREFLIELVEDDPPPRQRGAPAGDYHTSDGDYARQFDPELWDQAVAWERSRAGRERGMATRPNRQPNEVVAVEVQRRPPRPGPRVVPVRATLEDIRRSVAGAVLEHLGGAVRDRARAIRGRLD